MGQTMNITSTKFWLAVGCLLISAYGFLAGLMDGGTWVAAMSFILGLYGAADVAQKQVLKSAD
jgi:hypothetical protein